MGNRYCTVPKILGFRAWFERNFGSICKEHDNDYIRKVITRKEADLKMYQSMVKLGYPLFGSIVYWIFLRPLGWIYW